MNRDLGVWTYENSALVLIDYQNETFETIRSETSAELADLNVRLLARAAKAFDMPVVLSTVGVKYGINGPTHATILSDLPGVEPIDRTSMNAFEDRPFNDAVKKTGRKRLIIGGLHLAGKAREVIYWYFGEVTQVKANVGVSEAERRAVRDREPA